MRNKTLPWIFALVVLLILAVASNFLLYLKVPSTESLEAYLDKRLQEIHLQEGKAGADGYTPVKGVDYFDGKDGQDGTNGRDGQQGLQGVQGLQGIQGTQGEKGDKGDTGAKGEAGESGKTPEIRCNTVRNQWEVRYSEEENWTVLGESPSPCRTNN